ncbi:MULTISPECIES: hypothetical protein [Streptomyces]|uniref:Uncharacterized protein n=1 Tax=Streptomyces rubiginosohelvolus TaxID=67362 RepID=A0ABQ3BY82_9ACTN|nr:MULTISPECIES: hypothetical protein [Streptomyces]GGS07555.1 hypothetical protein GCM10010284_46080 [Streptomyces rubiginosohelvolus]GGZ57940.1 hypothetical protein GCM10010328_35720 [Streptomyces pluricolorescens]
MSEAPAGLPVLADLPGARAQLRGLTEDLRAGLNSIWLLPDRLVANGQAEELYLRALSGARPYIDVPSTLAADAELLLSARQTESRPARVAGYGADADQLPYLDQYDDGFDLGWETDGYVPVIPAPRAESTRAAVSQDDLTLRVAKELSVQVDDVIAWLVAPGSDGPPPVIGIRAWAEPDGGPVRGAAVERLYRSLSAAVKAAGLPPGERPRLLVAARLRDLPTGLPDALHLDSAATTVHWWWGALGRLDVSTAVASCLTAARTAGRDGDSLGDRVLRQLTAETVIEVCGPDLELARRLALDWDGRQRTLDAALRRCLAAGTPVTGGSPEAPTRMGARHRPGVDVREAWSGGAIAAWEGRLRTHPGTWYPVGPAAELTGDARARLAALIAQAQQRVVLPWIEEARQRLAARSLHHLNRPVESVVEDYIERPALHLRTRPERAFLEIQVGELLHAHRQGAVALPGHEAQLLRLLVKVRNILSHRSVLHDATVREFGDELSRSDLRTP